MSQKFKTLFAVSTGAKCQPARRHLKEVVKSGLGPFRQKGASAGAARGWEGDFSLPSALARKHQPGGADSGMSQMARARGGRTGWPLNTSPGCSEKRDSRVRSGECVLVVCPHSSQKIERESFAEGHPSRQIWTADGLSE